MTADLSCPRIYSVCTNDGQDEERLLTVCPVHEGSDRVFFHRAEAGSVDAAVERVFGVDARLHHSSPAPLLILVDESESMHR